MTKRKGDAHAGPGYKIKMKTNVIVLTLVAVARLELAPHSRTLSVRCSTILNYTAI